MQDNRLVIYPRDALTPLPAGVDLLQLLRDVGLVGEAFTWQDRTHFLVGERFLELISFLGCSPFINIEPSMDGSEFCHIRLAYFDAPRLLAGSNARLPRCPACKQELPNWREWQGEPFVGHACQACGAAIKLAELNWRRTAAVACVAIYIYGVHDSEAVPTELLLSALERHTGLSWSYYYQQN